MKPSEVIAALDAAHNDLSKYEKVFDNVMDRVAIEDAIAIITELSEENVRLTKDNEALKQALNISGVYEEGQ